MTVPKHRLSPQNPGNFTSIIVAGTEHVYTTDALRRLLAYDGEGLLSADVELPEALKAGSLVASEIVVVARGEVSFWCPTNCPAAT